MSLNFKLFGMKPLMLILGVIAMNTGFSQIKIGGDNTFDLIVRINYFRPHKNVGCEMVSSRITLIGNVQNALDKTALGDEVELIFEQPWKLNRITNGGVYKLKVQYYNPIIDLNIKNQAGYDTINSKKTKLLVINISTPSQV